MVEVIQDRERLFPDRPGLPRIREGLVGVAEAAGSLGLPPAMADLAIQVAGALVVGHGFGVVAELLVRVRFWLTSNRESVLIRVWDGDHRPPVRQEAGLDAEAGRGLLLVETLSAQWGCYAPDGPDSLGGLGGLGGKIVWVLCAQ